MAPLTLVRGRRRGFALLGLTENTEAVSAPPLTETQIAQKLSSENLDELLQLWWAEQGVAKHRDLELMAAALPFPTDANLRVLDMCCGPGDVGRVIRGRYRNSCIDCVDRDVFLISICDGINRREGVSAESFVRDLWNTDWHTGCATTMTWWRPRTHFTGLTHHVLRSCSMISPGCLVPGDCFCSSSPLAPKRPSPLDSRNGSRDSHPVTAGKTGNASGRERTIFLATITRNS